MTILQHWNGDVNGFVDSHSHSSELSMLSLRLLDQSMSMSMLSEKNNSPKVDASWRGWLCLPFSTAMGRGRYLYIVFVIAIVIEILVLISFLRKMWPQCYSWKVDRNHRFQVAAPLAPVAKKEIRSVWCFCNFESLTKGRVCTGSRSIELWLLSKGEGDWQWLKSLTSQEGCMWCY